MRVLITGVTGFVGGHLAREIANNDPSVEMWGIRHVQKTGDDPKDGAEAELPREVQLRGGDITDEAFVRDVVREAKPDHVYHMAGYASGKGTDRDLILA